MTTTSSQLARLLRLVPYLSAHQGISVLEVATAFDTTPKQIIRDLEVLQFCGLPGGFHGDLFELDIDAARDEGHIEFHNADVLARPFKLRREEAASLLAALGVVVELTGASAAASSALAKLKDAVGATAEVVRIDVARTNPGHRAELERAIEQRKVVELSYRASVRPGISTAPVEPAVIGVRDGFPYLWAWSRARDDWRSFRLDRIEEVRVTDETFDERGAPEQLWFTDAPEELTLTVTTAGAWIAEYYPTTAVQVDGDLLRVTMPLASRTWAAALVLRLQSNLVAISDPAVAASARASARLALDAYHRHLG